MPNEQDYLCKSHNLRDLEFDLAWAVDVYFYRIDDEVSIEQYLLDGDNISREELIDRFGVICINELEYELNEQTNEEGL